MTIKKSVARVSVALTALLCIQSGCDSNPPAVDVGRPDSAPVPVDAGSDAPCIVPTAESIDLLFMIDSSGSMREEQANLIAEIPRLVRVLSSGDIDLNGTTDFPPASLHVGVVTSDMGSGDEMNVRTCTPGLGDDGILRSTSRTTTAPCMATYPSGTFSFMSGDTNAFAAALGCVADIGTNGCGFEQQLEAPLKALTPAAPQAWTRVGYTPPRFFDPTTGMRDLLPGHATAANAGFVREDSILAVVLVTDEEDCSVADYSIFGSSDPRFSALPANVRCNAFSADDTVVYGVDRYVAGFLGLRRNPSRLVFSAIVGIPPETEVAAAANDFRSVFANPSMQPRIAADGFSMEPSCMTTNGIAYPPVRIVETAAAIQTQGANVSVSSICTPTFAVAIDRLIAQVDAAAASCD